MMWCEFLSFHSPAHMRSPDRRSDYGIIILITLSWKKQLSLLLSPLHLYKHITDNNAFQCKTRTVCSNKRQHVAQPTFWARAAVVSWLFSKIVQGRCCHTCFPADQTLQQLSCRNAPSSRRVLTPPPRLSAPLSLCGLTGISLLALGHVIAGFFADLPTPCVSLHTPLWAT